MHKYLRCLPVLLLLCGRVVCAQTFHDTCAIDYSGLKGKLICINELHSVDANDQVYTRVAGRLAAGDSLTLLLEIPYSLCYLYNRYLDGDTSIHFAHPLSPLITTARQQRWPVRFFGCDFEYDKGKRGQIYVLFLKHIAATLAKARLDNQPLNTYIASLGDTGSWIERPVPEPVADFYRDLLPRCQGLIATRVRELLFVLNARHKFHAHRDPVIYRRIIEAEKQGFIHFRHYNLLVHGSAHISPTFHRNLYHYFQKRASSPFRDKVYIIAQAYVDCYGNSGYFARNGEKQLTSGSVFSLGKRNDALIGVLRQYYIPSYTGNSVTCIKAIPELDLPEHYRSRILYWYVQYKTE